MKTTVAGEETREPVASAIDDSGCRFTVIYDGDCKVCGRMVKLLDRLDRNDELEIIPSQAPGVRARFREIPPRAYVESVQVVRKSDGQTWQAAPALAELLTV